MFQCTVLAVHTVLLIQFDCANFGSVVFYGRYCAFPTSTAAPEDAFPFLQKCAPPPKSEPLYPRPYILYAVSCAAMTVLMRRSALGGVEKHRGRPKTGESCSKLRGSARVGDALGLESLHKGDLMHCEGASGSDSKWNGRSARACAVRNGRHKRVSVCTARQQLLQLICKLLGRQGRLARAKINCDTYTTCSTKHTSIQSRIRRWRGGA